MSQASQNTISLVSSLSGCKNREHIHGAVVLKILIKELIEHRESGSLLYCAKDFR